MGEQNRTGPSWSKKEWLGTGKKGKMTGWGSTTKSIIPIFNSKLIQIELEKKKRGAGFTGASENQVS